MNKEDFDKLWRMEAVKIAAIEQMEMYGRLDFETLFPRAHRVWDEGFKYGIEDWQGLYKAEDAKAPAKELAPKVDTAETKVCPGCGETVPIGWKKHVVKKDGSTKCGHKFT